MTKMPALCLFILSLSLFFLSALSAQAAEEDLPNLERAEQLAGRKAQPVEGSSLLYVFLYEDEAQKAGIPFGLYLYGTNGAFEGILEYEPDMGPMGQAPILSPDGQILAVDAGEVESRWYFYSYPRLSHLKTKPLDYVASGASSKMLLWQDENTIFVHSQLTGDSEGRICHYESCGPISIIRYSLDDSSESTVLEATPLCDYVLENIEGNTLKARKVCLERLEDWKDYPLNTPGEIVEVRLR